MVTCGGQATIPIVAARRAGRRRALRRDRRVHRLAVGRARHPRQHRRVHRDHGARPSSTVGGAAAGKAIIVLNPAEPPLIMRDTVLALVHDPDGLRQAAIRESVARMVADVAAYVPGYRLKQDGAVHARSARTIPCTRSPARPGHATRSRVFLEVEGAAHYLPAYAGNLDIMTSAALRVAERIGRARRRGRSAGDDRRVYLQDVTLRDGMHAMRHRVTLDERRPHRRARSTPPASTPSRSPTATDWPAAASTTAPAATPTGSGSRWPRRT